MHVATALLAFLAGCINAIGVGLFASTIGNVTGLVTALAIDLATKGGWGHGTLVNKYFTGAVGLDRGVG